MATSSPEKGISSEACASQPKKSVIVFDDGIQFGENVVPIFSARTGAPYPRISDAATILRSILYTPTQVVTRRQLYQDLHANPYGLQTNKNTTRLSSVSQWLDKKAGSKVLYKRPQNEGYYSQSNSGDDQFELDTSSFEFSVQPGISYFKRKDMQKDPEMQQLATDLIQISFDNDVRRFIGKYRATSDINDTVDDILADTTFNILTYVASGQGDINRNLRSYFVGSAINLIRDKIRRAKSQEAMLRAHATSLVSSSDSAEREVFREIDHQDHAKDKRRQLLFTEERIDALPERQGAVARYRIIEGLSEKETAWRLGISLGAVKSHFAKARAKLDRDTIAQPHEQNEQERVRIESPRMLASLEKRAELSDIQRDIARLRINEGLSENETAERLGMAVDTVKTHIALIREKLTVERQRTEVPSMAALLIREIDIFSAATQAEHEYANQDIYHIPLKSLRILRNLGVLPIVRDKLAEAAKHIAT